MSIAFQASWEIFHESLEREIELIGPFGSTSPRIELRPTMAFRTPSGVRPLIASLIQEEWTMSSRRYHWMGLGCVLLGTLASLSVSSVSSPVVVGSGTAPYDIIDRIEGSFVNLNHFPVRPIVAHPSGTGFFALNTHASTLERFDGVSTTPVDVWSTPWGPVAMALWNDPVSENDQLLVSCRGSHVMARMDPVSGEVLGLLPLPSEPADIVVKHDTDQAFIACSAKDIVVQVDLLTDATIEYSPASHPNFNVKNPTFLAISTSGKIMVPSMHSGNNSTASKVFQRRAGEVIDLEDPDYAVVGLPDEDLFRIDPVAQAIVPIGRRIGTTLFGIGVNPETTRTWVLNTDAKNKGPDRQSEQAVRGDIVANRLSIIRPNITVPPPEPDFYFDLDDSDPGTAGIQFDPDQTVGQPFNLDFLDNGNAFIVGLLTDNFIRLDKDGNRLGEWDLPEGAIPRAVKVDETAGVLWVYCWGNNQVLEYRLSDMALLRTCQLSNDPTPANIARGREIFYDASHSEHNNAACTSCHIDGRSDLLVWNLQDSPQDEKGPLLTQTMSGIDRVGPFHWRGERSELMDFNIAFKGLMGGDKLGRKQFADFEAFVFSLTNPANPWAHRERLLDDTSLPYHVDPSAQATLGQVSYQTFVVQGTNFCTTCHQLPLGTNHDIFSGEPTEDISRRVFNKVPPFNETYRRVTSEVMIETLVEPGNPGAGTVVQPRGYLGVGATHAGLIESFQKRIADFGGGTQTFHMTSFVLQLDQGVAPAIHQAFLLDAANLAATQPELENYLMPQAALRNCDVVVFGRSEPGAVTTRWAWDRQSASFVPDHPSIAARTLTDFINNAAGESHVFMGMPVGTAARSAIDRDLDGLVNSVDPAPETPFVDAGDTTAPVFTVTPQLLWATSKTARVAFETDEPTVYRITYGEGHVPNRCVPKSADCQATSSEWSTAHTPLLKDLLPSTNVSNGVYDIVTFTYDTTIEVFDRAGNSTTFALPQFDSAPYGPRDDQDIIIGGLNWRRFDDFGPGPLQAAAEVKVIYKHGATPQPPAPDRVVVARVLVDGEVNTDWVPLGPNSFKVDHVEVVGPTDSKRLNVDGPLLVGLETDVEGMTKLAFELGGLTVGQQVTLNIESVVIIDPAQAAAYHASLAAASACTTSGGPGTVDCDGDGLLDCCLEVPVTFHGRALTRWSFPDTQPQNRFLTERFDPADVTTIPLH